MARSGAAASFEAGVHPLHYWPAAVIFAGLIIGLAVVVVRTVQAEVWSGAALIFLFLLMSLWHAVNFLRRNRPTTYRTDALPRQLMP